MFNSIVYKSTTGSCEKYADMLSAALHIPARPLGKEYVTEGSKIIYVGWAFAGKIVGYAKAAKKYNIGAVVQVGMSPVYEGSEQFARKKNGIAPSVAVFVRQGAFNINKLPLPLKLIMRIKNKEIAERMSKKTNPTEAEKATLKMAQSGVGQPPEWKVDDIVKWCENN